MAAYNRKTVLHHCFAQSHCCETILDTASASEKGHYFKMMLDIGLQG